MWLFDRSDSNKLLTEEEIRRNLDDRESPRVCSPACEDSEVRFAVYLLLCLLDKQLPDFVKKGRLETGRHVSGVRKHTKNRTILLVSSSYAGWITQDYLGNGKRLKLLRPVHTRPINLKYTEHRNAAKLLATFPDTKAFDLETEYIQMMLTLFKLNNILVDTEQFQHNSTFFSRMYLRTGALTDQ